MSTGIKPGMAIPVVLVTLVGIVIPANASFDPFDLLRINPESDQRLEKIEYQLPLGVLIVNANSILQAKSLSKEEQAPPKFLMHITAYSSSVDETDSTPFITASGTRVRDGIVASNAFPLGTKIKIPELYGDKILVIEDRMHERFTDRVDVWMPSKSTALTFGKKQAEVEIVEL